MIDMLKSNPQSGRIAYVDAHAYWKANAYFVGSLPDSVHLSNEGQERIAEYLTEPVAKMVVDHFP
jgi:lysophospholipase L1-like esterase